jgi:hypothetical protein
VTAVKEGDRVGVPWRFTSIVKADRIPKGVDDRTPRDDKSSTWKMYREERQSAVKKLSRFCSPPFDGLLT